ncbi:LpxD N-terminal domain-containing protein [Microcella sp.]|uniref:LpxD N-terminal domain-containing protein n=1 Tax=Microcella sp. TaxID=1913979 RepID=UPI003F6F922D
MTQHVVPSTQIAAALHGSHRGREVVATGVATVADAGTGQLCFAGDLERYALEVDAALAAGAIVLVPEGQDSLVAGEGAIITVANPRAAFADAVRQFFAPVVEPGIAGTAVVHPTASIAASASIGEFTVIGRGAVIAEGVEVRHHAVIAAGVRIGAGSLIKSHAVIGEEGFGIDKDEHDNNIRLPHLGSVVIGEQVEVGNFTTVCSGTIAPSRVGDYTKIDDHVHIAHNVQIGRNVIITACAEVSGSVVIEDEVWIGPNASVIQGLTLGARSLIGMGSVVVKSVPADEVHFGSPARKVRSKAEDQ